MTGSVQGVGFRWSTRTVADKYAVSGWVRNRSDGAVEAELEGSPEAVDSMLAWLRKGPPSASVSDVDVVELPATGETGFEVEPR